MQETLMVTHTLANALASHVLIEKPSFTNKPPQTSADVTPPSGQIISHKLLDTRFENHRYEVSKRAIF